MLDKLSLLEQIHISLGTTAQWVAGGGDSIDSLETLHKLTSEYVGGWVKVVQWIECGLNFKFNFAFLGSTEEEQDSKLKFRRSCWVVWEHV